MMISKQFVKYIKALVPSIPGMLWKAGKNFNANDGFIRASAVTYATIIAVVPFVILLSWIAGFFGYWELLLSTLPELINASRLDLPLDSILPFFENITIKQQSNVGIWGILALSFSFIGVMNNLDTNFNSLWGNKNRNIVKRYLTYLPFVIIVLLFIVTLSFIMSHIRYLLEQTFHQAGSLVNSDFTALSDFLRVQSLSLSGMIFLWAFLFALYWLIPNCKIKMATAATTSSLVLGILFIIGLLSYSFQQLIFMRLNVMYGSLSIIPFMMLVLYIIWIAVLFGGALSVEIQQWLQSHKTR
jgi:membrane protein